MKTRCAIVGGGPAGMMLGFLLARSGIEVVVLEKHADFFRDFRGDTIHPSTLELMHELGLLDDFLAQPHDEIRRLSVQFGDEVLPVGDLDHLPARCRFIALMPQWDFLNFLAERARRYPSFQLLMDTAFERLVVEDGAVRGIIARGAGGAREIRAELVVGADGRSSDVRAAAGLAVRSLGAPIDVLWMRFSRRPSDPVQVLGRVDYGQMMVMLDRRDYWQCAYLIRKGSLPDVQARGIEAFRATIARLVPFLADRAGELHGWDDVKLLTVTVDRLRTWARPGLLCIGDAAHAMSPIGGVGINLAIQDAVAAANRLVPAFARGTPALADLRAVQRRRTWPTVVIQSAQVAIQNVLLARLFAFGERKMRAPAALRAVSAIPLLRRLPGLLVGIGPRPEHIRTPEAEVPR